MVDDEKVTGGEHECRCRLRHGVHQDRGRRSAMEDCHVIEHDFNRLVATALGEHPNLLPQFTPPIDNSVYFGLFDGHAGSMAAHFCQLHLHENIARSVPFSSDLCDAMSRGFLLTDRQFLDAAQGCNDESGSVCVSMIFSGDTLHIAHTGDSRAVLCRDGVPILLTADHKPTMHAEKIRVEKNGGTVEWDMLNGVLEVSRAIGDFDRDQGVKTRGLTALPETRILPIGPLDEFVIVACDGLWDVIDSDAAVSFARAHLSMYDSIQGVTESLVQEALRRQSDDNITVIVVGFPKRDLVTQTGDRIVAIDAKVDILPDYVQVPSDHIIRTVRTPPASESDSLDAESGPERRRPRICPTGFASVQGFLE